MGCLTKHKTTRNHDVSVVILTKNSESTIERCLCSVMSQKPGEILVVDSRSTDLTLKILDGHEVKILHDASGSLGACRQLGVMAARERFVMFVDSDVELGTCCIARLRYDVVTHQWAGAHAMILSIRNMSYWQRSEDTAFSLFFNHIGPKKQIGTIATMFRRRVLLKYPFDPEFRESCEDVDLCRRLSENGYRLGVSNAVAYHNHRQQFIAFARQRFNYGLGDARLWLKYRDHHTLVRPLMAATSYTLRTRRIWLVPYWLASGVIGFLGIVAGLRRNQNMRPHFETQPEPLCKTS